MHEATKIAKWFLAHNHLLNTDGDTDAISNLKLQKLLYYAQGIFLAIEGKPIFSDPILAWQHGPVVECVYHEYKGNGSCGIPFDGVEPDYFDEITPEEERLLSDVFDIFGQFSAWKLREMTHNERPWQETEQNDKIDIELLREFFTQYVEENIEL